MSKILLIALALMGCSSTVSSGGYSAGAAGHDSTAGSAGEDSAGTGSVNAGGSASLAGAGGNETVGGSAGSGAAGYTAQDCIAPLPTQFSGSYNEDYCQTCTSSPCWSIDLNWDASTLHYDEAYSTIHINLTIHSKVAPTLLGYNNTACPTVSCSLDIPDATLEVAFKVVPVSDGYEIVMPGDLWYFDGLSGSSPDLIQPGTCTILQTQKATQNMQSPWRDVMSGLVLPCVKPSA
jgi:hypothetical protein